MNRLLVEIAKCDVLCDPCHKQTHRESKEAF